MIKRILILFIFFGAFFYSCNLFNNNNIPKNNPPKLPGVNSFTFNASVLDNDTITPDMKFFDFNFLNAARKISLWRIYINKNIKTTLELMNFAVKNSDFQFYSNNSWLFQYSFSEVSDDYKVKIYGTFNADSSVTWEMFVVKNGNPKIRLLKGETNSYDTQGNWIFYSFINPSAELMKIDWIKTDTAFSKTFYNLDVTSLFKGSFINLNYLKNSSFEYNMFIQIYNSRYNSHAEIRLDTNSFAGSLKSPLNYQDTLWHCWNRKFNDIDCPN